MLAGKLVTVQRPLWYADGRMPAVRKRTVSRYQPGQREPFKLSRSKIDLFHACPRCFFLDRRLGIGRPQGPPFTLNNAVDKLLKKEFDTHRAAGTKHPLMEHYRIDAIPFAHQHLNQWRENFVGVQHLHEPTNFLVTGAIDDLWVNPKGELIVVDYKATSKEGEVSLEGRWQQSYKRQLEVYQWLLRRNGFVVSPQGYFVYCNGRTDRQAFDGKLEFDVVVLPYRGDDAWVEPALISAKTCLAGSLPQPAEDCEYCSYRAAAQPVEH